jgi:hypothetical protein
LPRLHCNEPAAGIHTIPANCALPLSVDYGFERGLDRFGWDEENNSCHYVRFVSPPLVVEIATRLRGLSFEQVATKLDEPSRGAASSSDN